MGLNQWMRVFDTVANLAQMTGRFKREGPAEPGVPPPTALGQIETRLAGVVVAALKEAFGRDRARMDLERAAPYAERPPTQGALPADLRLRAPALCGASLLLALWAPGPENVENL